MSMHALHSPGDLDSVFAPPPDDFTGTSGNDKIRGTSGNDSFDMSQGGNDKVIAGGGNDLILMGSTLTAHDKINGGAGFDELDLAGDYSHGVVFNATTMTNVESLHLFGSEYGGGSYTITLNDANIAHGSDLRVLLDDNESQPDVLNFDASAESDGDIFVQTLGDASDHIVGGGGNDHINGGRIIADVLDGGGGFNVVTFTNAGQSVNVSLLLQGQSQDIGSGHSVTISNFEGLGGSPHADTLTGDDNANWISTGGGNDTVHAGGGNDFIIMGDFDSAVVILDGGADNDTLSFQFFEQGGVTFSLALQGTAQAAGATTVTATDFENVVGTDAFDDSLTGDDGANQLFGGGGNDVLSGGKGDDTLYGDGIYGPKYTDPDQIGFASFTVTETGSGNDVLNGGAGSDKLVGGLGADTLTGGTGADKFVFETVQDSGVGAGNRDIITDFSHAGGDKIDLHLIDADTTQNGDQAFHLGGSSFTGSAGELIQFSDGSGNTIVAGDVNGDGVADFEIQLAHAPVLVAGDFVL